jgi:transposase
MTTITTIGIDLAKKVFQVHGVDAEGKVVVARKLRRKQVLALFDKLAPCLVGMEACGSAHYWGREIAKLGHTVNLMPPKYVKAYVKRGKTDAIDAAAICEAVTRPSMSFVPVKGIEQQGLSMLHSARLQLINGVRGHLSELGIVAERGLLGLAELAAIVRDESDHRLPVTARAALIVLVRQIEAVSAEISALDTALRKENKASELGPRLETIPSVGPVIASALRARVTDAKLFENGRHLSAWIGLVPENDSTGGKVRQNGLSKKGDRYLRSLLVAGAMAVVQQARTRTPGSRSCSAACRQSRRRSRSPTRPRGSPGPSWSTAASTRPAIAPPNIERRRARSPDKWVGDGVIAAAAAND